MRNIRLHRPVATALDDRSEEEKQEDAGEEFSLLRGKHESG